MNTSKIIPVVCSALILVSCRTTTVNLEERFRKGELTVSEYLRLRDQRKTEESVPQTNYGSNALAALGQIANAASKAMNSPEFKEQQRQNQQQLKEQRQENAAMLDKSTRQIQRSINEMAQSAYRVVPDLRMEPSNSTPRDPSLPTTAQITTPGVWTGNVKYASDMTPYREYRRPDGSTYWSRPPVGW